MWVVGNPHNLSQTEQGLLQIERPGFQTLVQARLNPRDKCSGPKEIHRFGSRSEFTHYFLEPGKRLVDIKFVPKPEKKQTPSEHTMIGDEDKYMPQKDSSFHEMHPQYNTNTPAMVHHVDIAMLLQ